MAEFDDLLGALKDVVGAAASVNYADPAKLDDIYEGYLWSEVVRVAKAAGWTVAFENAGPGSDAFVFRKGPGRFNSPVAYSFAKLQRWGKTLEVHIGVRVRGSSNVLHEFDVLVLRGEAADFARKLKTDPGHVGAAMHLEAKFFSGQVTLGEARALLGLSVDCGGLRAHLVSRGGGSPSVRQLLKPHGSTYVHDVMPGEEGPKFLETCIKAALKFA